ncbi:MAG: hypothetical protein IPN92_08925 [Chromatiaceae bacterium]|nr:hypothetical protein [Chromatiaceae bacterium]
MSRPLTDAAVVLWREAPPWRYLVIAASVTTVLAVVSGWTGSNSGRQPPTTGSLAQVPGTVIQPTIPVNQASAARLQAFEARYRQLRNETQDGLKCEELAAAAQVLAGDDRVNPSSTQATALAEADRCRNRLQESDSRWSRFVTASKAAPSDASATLDLVNAAGSMTPFDKTRTLAAEQRGALQAGDRATADLVASDQRLAALEKAVGAFSPTDAPAAYAPVATATQAITRLDQGRMNEVQSKAYQAAMAVASALEESRSRLGAAITAVESFERAPSAETREALVSQVPKVTTFDLALADSGQQAALARGRSAARVSGLDLLVTKARDYREDPSVDAHEALADLVPLLADVATAELSNEQKEALDVARQAAGALATSDSRIKAVTGAAEAWRRGHTGSAARMVTNAFDALTDFDRARLGPSGNAALDQIQRAYFIVQGPKSPLTQANKRYLNLFVQASDPGVARTFETALRRAGWQITTDREAAALIVKLEGTVTGQGQTLVGSRTVESARSQLSARIDWAFTNEQLFYDAAEGNGVGSSNALAIEKSFERAASVLVKSLDKRVGS